MGSRRTACGRGGRSLQPQGKVNFHVARRLGQQVEYQPEPAATRRSRQVQLGFSPMDCNMPGFPVPHHLPEFAKFMSKE